MKKVELKNLSAFKFLKFELLLSTFSFKKICFTLLIRSPHRGVVFLINRI